MVETLESKVRKARKTHSCDYCGGEISVGQHYEYSKLKQDYIYEWKSHTECGHIAQALWNWIDPDEGLDGEHFQMACQEFCQAFTCPKCEYWDGDDCALCQVFCADKISDILRTHDFKRIKKDGDWMPHWELVAK